MPKGLRKSIRSNEDEIRETREFYLEMTNEQLHEQVVYTRSVSGIMKIDDPDLKLADRLVLGYINSKTINLQRFVDFNETIGRNLFISANQANVSINKLARKGYIKIYNRGTSQRYIESTTKLNLLNPNEFIIKFLTKAGLDDGELRLKYQETRAFAKSYQAQKFSNFKRN